MQDTDTIQADLEGEVLKALLYFDIFKYPLKSREVFHFLSKDADINDVERALNNLVAEKTVYRFSSFFSLQNSEQNVTRRINGNREAERITPFALKRARFIASFPFVKAVMASGSYSKNYMDESSDLDFFIITTTGGLWIARTLLACYKRVFLRNSHKYFCTNYFVDEDHLEIPEKNLFTATELATLIPLVNPELYHRLIASNRWVHDFLPNFTKRPLHQSAFLKSSVGRILEAAIYPFSGFTEKILMRLSMRRLERLYRHQYTADDFKIAFKSTHGTSKNHPRNFQKHVLALYAQKLIEHDLLPL